MENNENTNNKTINGYLCRLELPNHKFLIGKINNMAELDLIKPTNLVYNIMVTTLINKENEVEEHIKEYIEKYGIDNVKPLNNIRNTDVVFKIPIVNELLYLNYNKSEIETEINNLELYRNKIIGKNIYLNTLKCIYHLKVSGNFICNEIYITDDFINQNYNIIKEYSDLDPMLRQKKYMLKSKLQFDKYDNNYELSDKYKIIYILEEIKSQIINKNIPQICNINGTFLENLYKIAIKTKLELKDFEECLQEYTGTKNYNYAIQLINTKIEALNKIYMDLLFKI